MSDPHLSYLLICGITIIFIYFCNAGRRPPSSSILILCITISSAQFRAFNATSRFFQGSEKFSKLTNLRKFRFTENIDSPKISIHRKYRLLKFSDPCLVKDYDLSSQWCIQTICDETFHEWLLWWHCSPWFNCWWFAHLTVRNDCSSVTYKIMF